LKLTGEIGELACRASM